MNNFIVIPLLFLAICAGFYQLFAVSNVINLSSNQQIQTNIPNAGHNAWTGDTLWQHQLGIGNPNPPSDNNYAAFNVEMTTGVIALIIAMSAVAVLAGLRLFSSGLSETSIKIIYNSTVYYGLWGIFSALSYPLFLAIPILGVFGWFILTLIYSLGYFEQVK